MTASSTAATAWSAITTGTNANALVVGTGGTLGTSGTGTITANLASGTAIAQTGVDINTSFQVTALHLASPLPVANGGTGTATPALVQGTNVTITGTWPNQTINASSSSQTYPAAGIMVSTGAAFGTSLVAPTGAIVGISDTQTLTNKSIAASEVNSGAIAAARGGTAIDTSASTGVGQVAAGTWSVSTALANGTTATTQTVGDNTTKLATTAFVLANAGGAPAWSSITAPSGNLALSMSSNTSIFSTTTALSELFGWENTTAAVVGTSQGSPIPLVCGTGFHSSASVKVCAGWGLLPGNGNDAAITVNHLVTTTSTGQITDQFSGGVAAGSDGVHPAYFDFIGNTTAPTIASNHFQLVGPNATTFTAYGLQFSTTNPAANQLMAVGAPVSGVAPVTYVSSARGISFTMGDPTGSALTTSEVAYVTVPFACTIAAYNILVDAGTITLKTWKIATGTAIPTSANSISTSGVSISSGTAIHSTTVSDFTSTAVAANDIVAAAITAVSTAKFVNFTLQCNQ